MTIQHDASEIPEPDASRRAAGSSFYAAMRIMPPGQREAMFEIYAFCRAVDDIADDGGRAALRLEQLTNWGADIDAIYQGRPPRRLAGLATAVKAFNLARGDFHAVIDGMKMDVTGEAVAPDLALFDLYCDRVASAVGRLSVRVFGLEENDGLRLAHHLGRALQITNILRDLDEDSLMERLYLPREMLAAEGIASADAAAVLSSPAIDAVCRTLVVDARRHFAEADAIMQRYPRRTVRTPRVMSQAYQAILASLEARGWAPPRAPIRLSRARLAWVLLRHAIL